MKVPHYNVFALYLNVIFNGTDCGSVGREEFSDTRGPRFEFSHCQIYLNHNFVENTNMKIYWPFFDFHYF